MGLVQPKKEEIQIDLPEAEEIKETRKSVKVKCPKCKSEWWAPKSKAERSLDRHLEHCRRISQ